MQEPLHLLPVEKWSELQRVFKSDWLRNMPAYYTLETQRLWFEQGFYYGFKVYCPYGDLWNGMVAVNEKRGLYEIIILCPRDDTEKLEEALRKTKVINWNRTIIVPFAPDFIMDGISRVVGEIGVEFGETVPCISYILEKNRTPFQDVNLPPGVTFDLLTEDHIDIVDSKWPHRYPGSEWYHEHMIISKNGFGLFHNHNLAAWVFINDTGALGHLYVLEEYRRRGYAELIVKILCNKLFEEGKDAMVFCVKGNVGACSLYKKLGFTLCQNVTWFYLEKAN